MAVETVWDAANVAMGVGSFMANVAAGNVGGAALDAVGVILDSAATVTPCVPGGAGTAIKLLRGADKAADLVKAADKAHDIRKAADKANEVRKASDKAEDVAKAADKATDSGKSVGQKTARETAEQSKKAAAKGGETAATKAGRQAHKDWNPGEGFEKEVTLPSGKRVDAVNFEKRHVKELKPDNPRAVKRGEKQVEPYRQELQAEHGGDWKASVETYEKKK